MRRLFLSAVCLLVLSGCAFFNIRKAGEDTRLAGSEAVIFGKIIISENGRALAPYGFFERPSPTMFHAESGRYSWTITAKDGSFSWVVPAGSYIVPEVQFGGVFIHPGMAFSAPEGGAYYLGTMRIDIERMDFFTEEPPVNKVEITDELEQGAWPLAERFRSKTRKSIAIYDPSLPKDLTDRESLTHFLVIFGTLPK